MPVNKGFHGFRRGGLADGIRDVDGEKIGTRNEAIHRFQPDVIGIDVIGLGPSQLSHGTVGGTSNTGGLRADYIVFPIRFIPDRNDIDAVFRGQQTGLELRFGLMRESISHTQRVFTE
jgi:hypothetical protein